jgi:hypothetical protein
MQRIDILETYSFHGEILVKLKKNNSSLEENIASPIKLNVLSPLVKFQHFEFLIIQKYIPGIL